MSLRRFAALFAVPLAVASAPLEVCAQGVLPARGAGPSLHVEVTKPFASRHGPFAGARSRTSVWDASAVVPFAGGPTLFARMGITYASIEGISPSMTLGKPRLGAMLGGAHRTVEVHVDIPVGKEYGEDYATGIGIFADYEELERFETDTWSMGASASTEWETPTPNAFVGLRVGATVLVPDGGADTFGFLSVFAHAPTVETRFRFDFSTLVRMSGTGMGFDERSTFFAALEIARPNARFAPAIFVRAPIDDSLDGSIALVVGLRFQLGG